MSQKSKLRRRQRNERANGRTDDDDPQPGRQYGDAEAYFEEMKRKWESQNGQSQASSNR